MSIPLSSRHGLALFLCRPTKSNGTISGAAMQMNGLFIKPHPKARTLPGAESGARADAGGRRQMATTAGDLRRPSRPRGSSLHRYGS